MSIISETGVIMVTYTGLSGLYTGIMMIKIQFLEFTVDWGKPIMDSCHAMTLGCHTVFQLGGFGGGIIWTPFLG